MNRTLHSIEDIVSAFGGPPKLAEWAGVGVTAVHNWLARGEIPPCWHMPLILECARRKQLISPEAFGIEGDDAKLYTRIFRQAPASLRA